MVGHSFIHERIQIIRLRRIILIHAFDGLAVLIELRHIRIVHRCIIETCLIIAERHAVQTLELQGIQLRNVLFGQELILLVQSLQDLQVRLHRGTHHLAKTGFALGLLFRIAAIGGPESIGRILTIRAPALQDLLRSCSQLGLRLGRQRTTVGLLLLQQSHAEGFHRILRRHTHVVEHAIAFLHFGSFLERTILSRIGAALRHVIIELRQRLRGHRAVLGLGCLAGILDHVHVRGFFLRHSRLTGLQTAANT